MPGVDAATENVRVGRGIAGDLLCAMHWASSPAFSSRSAMRSAICLVAPSRVPQMTCTFVETLRVCPYDRSIGRSGVRDRVRR